MQKVLLTLVRRTAFLVTRTTLFLTVSSASAQTAQSVTLAWNRNPASDIAGYRLYYGTSSGTYTWLIDAGNTLAFTVLGLTAGQTYYFVATDYNTAGVESPRSNEVTYTAVAVPPPPPTVSLLVAPTAGNKFVVPVGILLTASASDTGSTIARVEFYNGNSYLGEVTTPPYTFVLNHPIPGNYSLTARAVNDQGASTTSAAADVTVTAPPLPTSRK